MAKGEWRHELPTNITIEGRIDGYRIDPDGTRVITEVTLTSAAIVGRVAVPPVIPDTPVGADNPEVREALASYAHEAWSGWMKYMLNLCHRLSDHTGDTADDDAQVIPAASAQRWIRQMNTPYADPPEAEKESDRAEADKILDRIKRP